LVPYALIITKLQANIREIWASVVKENKVVGGQESEGVLKVRIHSFFHIIPFHLKCLWVFTN
jgi:hypothetical protein